MRKIFIASDHAGFELKEFLADFLRQKGDCEVVDLGVSAQIAKAGAKVDYPDFAKSLCRELLDSQKDSDSENLGVLVCGSGIGMSMAANRFSGVRAVVCAHSYMAKMARAHNNANVLCLGERFVGKDLAIDILETFLSAPFEGGRHANRVCKIELDKMD